MEMAESIVGTLSRFRFPDPDVELPCGDEVTEVECSFESKSGSGLYLMT